MHSMPKSNALLLTRRMSNLLLPIQLQTNAAENMPVYSAMPEFQLERILVVKR